VRPRTLLLFALVALLGAAAAVSPALATASEPKLEVNQNCVDPNWPCWATPGSNQPAFKTTVAAAGGTVMFVDHGKEANIAWTGTPGTTPTCESEVPVAPASTKTGWEGKCTFATPGIYKFESSTLFKEAQSAYGNNINYTKYEIVVAGTPVDTTTSASGETQTEAMLNGSINPEGNTVEYHFEYGSGSVTEHTTSPSTLSAADFTSHSVSAPVTGLQPGMTYHFQLVATYGGNAVAGATTLMFKTNTVAAPTATTLAAEVPKETEATLKGTVNLGGEATEYFFEYGTDTNYGQKTTKATLQTSGGSNQGVSAALKGLTPGTEYHFRLVAENHQGSKKGVDSSFKTASPAAKEPTPTLTPTPTPTSTPTPTPGPISPEPEIVPLVSPLVEGSEKLTAPRHGSVVGGSVEVSQSGAGGRLEVDLIANSASLAKVRHKKPAPAVVGRLVRTSLSAGKVSFSVSLNAKAKSALRRHHKLALSVQIVLTPLHGAAVTITRSIVLHA
jgi:hypothetical protein